MSDLILAGFALITTINIVVMTLRLTLMQAVLQALAADVAALFPPADDEAPR